MKKLLMIYVYIVITFGFTTILFAGAVIPKFEGKDGGNKVILEWVSIVEANLAHYEIERSFDQKNFTKIDKIEARGPSTYTYIDKSVFKQNSHVFYYRLRIVDKDNSTTLFWKILSVKPSISGIKHTWGSLKAMFR